jgi:hypothetical protein
MALVTGSGFGKTVMAGTAPRALFLTTDPEGTISAKRMGSTAEEWKIDSWQDKDGLTDAYTYMRREGCKEFDWLIHDNATEQQQLLMSTAIDERLATPRGRGGSPYVPEQREYLISQNGFIDQTKKFLALPINQIWTVHRKWQDLDPSAGDEDQTEGFWSANIQGAKGAVAEQFLGYMNIIGHGEVTKNRSDKEVRRLYFKHWRSFRGKDRFQALGSYQDDLTIPALMEKIEQSSKPVRKTAAKTATSTRRRVATRKTTN